jgi:hypothetical protein
MLPEPGSDPSWLTSSTSPSLRDSLALTSLLFVCCWRQQSVQPQIHGSCAVVVGPVIGKGDEGESSRSLAAAKEFYRLSKFGIVQLA